MEEHVRNGASNLRALNLMPRGLNSFLWAVGEPWRYVNDTLKLAYIKEYTW